MIVRGVDNVGTRNWKLDLLPYEKCVNELVVKFNDIRQEYLRENKQPPIEEVEGRIKSVASIIEKANRRRIPLEKSLEQLEDIAGVRIICRFFQDIDKVLEIIRKRSIYDMKILQEEDYIKNAKESGYRSYHVTIEYPVIIANECRPIKCEIQIRTMAMNFWSTIEHSLRYKYNGKVPDNIKNRLQSCADAAFRLDMEMSSIRQDLIDSHTLIDDRESIVDSIVDNIHKLSLVTSVEKMSEFNYQFLQLYQEGNILKLAEFNEQLKDLIGE